jgi:hypothetical protein
MLLKLEPKARELAEYMSGLSEEAYRAGWMAELEFELWDAVVNGPRSYGRLQITHHHIAQLQRLSRAAGGWIVFDADEEESLSPMEEWEESFTKWKEDTNRRRH